MAGAQHVMRGRAQARWREGLGPHRGGFTDKDDGFRFCSQCSHFPGNFEPCAENALREHESRSCETWTGPYCPPMVNRKKVAASKMERRGGFQGTYSKKVNRTCWWAEMGVRKSMGKARMMLKGSIGGSIECDGVPQVPHLWNGSIKGPPHWVGGELM